MDVNKWKEVLARNFEEQDGFVKFLDKKSKNFPERMQEGSAESSEIHLPSLVKLMNILNTPNRMRIPGEEAIFFLRGLITEIGNLLDYLKAPDSEWTDDIVRSMKEGGTMINATFQMTKEFDGSNFDLNETGIPYFLDLLTIFLFGEETKEMTADVQSERQELVSEILGQLRTRTLEPIVLRHLIGQTKAYFNRLSIGLKNGKKENVVGFNVINSTFSILNLLEVYSEGLQDIQEDEVTSLNSLARVADSAFPGFPLLGVAAGNIATHGKEIFKKQNGVDGFVQEDSSLNLNDLLSTLPQFNY